MAKLAGGVAVGAGAIIAALDGIGGLTLPVPVIASDTAIEIKADHFDMLVAERRTTYTGNVVANQGERTIESRQLVVQFNDDNEITALDATGEPAKLTDRAEASTFSVTSKTLNYRVGAATLYAGGNSVLSRGQDTIAAETIIYNIDTKTARAVGNDTERVSLRLAPLSNKRQ